MSPLDRPLAVTFFADATAQTKREESIFLRGLVDRVRTTTAPTKSELPWIKLATFGDLRTAQGALRNNANVLVIEGIEADYDSEAVSIDEAVAKLRAAGLAAMVYASPSHRLNAPRWRVLCPTSAPLFSADRDGLVARLNGVLGGTLARESFTLSQAYYFGAVAGSPDHRVELVEGRFIDIASELDAGAVGRTAAAAPIELPAFAAGAEPNEHAETALAFVLEQFSRDDIARHPTLVEGARVLAPFIKAGLLDAESAMADLANAMTESGRDPNHREVEDAFRWAMDRAQRYEPWSDGSEFKEIIEKLPPAPRRLPEIRLSVGNSADHLQAAEAALIEAGCGLYEQNGQVVCAAAKEIRRQGGERGEVWTTVEVNENYLRVLMDSSAVWLRFDGRKEKEAPVRCPLNIAREYLAMKGHRWRLPVLKSLINAPALRPDGTILDQPGYDVETELLFDPRGVVFPTIPEKPTKADATAALATLGDPISEFPFVSKADRSVALSAMLTAVARPSLDFAPMHAFTSPEPGSGKGLLARIASLIASGSPAPAASYSASEEEVRKSIDAALLVGAPIFCLDNVDHELKGARLNSVLTEGNVSVRVLGLSKNIEVTLNTFFMATGNNMSVAADMTRRLMMCRLDAGTERPEMREFKRNDLAGFVKAGRAGLVAAALTVLRAYIAAGRPGKPKPLGSYEAWSNLIRGALLWLGEADPVATMETTRAADPRRTEREAVLTQWNIVIGDARVTSAEIIRRATTGDAPEFREALLAVAGTPGGTINTHRLGSWIRANMDRPLDGLMIKRGKLRDGAPTWELHGGRRVSPAEGSNVIPLDPAGSRRRDPPPTRAEDPLLPKPNATSSRRCSPDLAGRSRLAGSAAGLWVRHFAVRGRVRGATGKPTKWG